MSEEKKTAIATVKSEIASLLDSRDANFKKITCAIKRETRSQANLTKITAHIDGIYKQMKADIDALRATYSPSDSYEFDEATLTAFQGRLFIKSLRKSWDTKAPMVWLLDNCGNESVLFVADKEKLPMIKVEYSDSQKECVSSITLVEDDAQVAWQDVSHLFKLSVVPITYECYSARHLDEYDEAIDGGEVMDEDESDEEDEQRHLYPIHCPYGDPLRIYRLHNVADLKRGVNLSKTLHRNGSCNKRNVMAWRFTSFDSDVDSASADCGTIRDAFGEDEADADKYHAAEERGATVVVTLKFIVATPIVGQ
jgi:hypothetical protein